MDNALKGDVDLASSIKQDTKKLEEKESVVSYQSEFMNKLARNVEGIEKRLENMRDVITSMWFKQKVFLTLQLHNVVNTIE